MKKISYTDFVIGKIYTRIYTGPNTAYGEINGKRTFEVTQLDPLRTRELYSQFGNPMNELKGSEGTFSHPEKAFEDYDLFETPDKKDWFIKSTIMSVKEALDTNIITMRQAKQAALHVTSWNFGKAFYMSCSVDASQRPKDNPYLQTVFFTWNSYKEMETDLLEQGVATKKQSNSCS